MSTLILVFVSMLLFVGMMAIGVLLGRKPIAGSCGGLKAFGADTACEICGGNPAKCDRVDRVEEAGLGYDVTPKSDRRREF